MTKLEKTYVFKLFNDNLLQHEYQHRLFLAINGESFFLSSIVYDIDSSY